MCYELWYICNGVGYASVSLEKVASKDEAIALMKWANRYSGNVLGLRYYIVKRVEV